jgi:histidine triad (HIT) family protein
VTELTTYRGTDFYCDVALPNAGRLDVVHETDRTLAYHHTRPFWPVHVVVIPKRHLSSFTTVGVDDEADLRDLLAVTQRIAAEVEREHGAARVLTNLGTYQDSKHLHVHVSSGDELGRHAANPVVPDATDR